MKHLKWLAAAVCAAALLIFPETALNAARTAMLSWTNAVAPALFPFMLLIPLLTCPDAVNAYERLLGRLMRPLLRLPGAAAPAVVIGMTAGSPAGAISAARVAAGAGMSRAQLTRLAACACGLSPAFLVAGIGSSMLRSAADGQLLFRTQLLTQLTMLLLTRGWRGEEPVLPQPEPQRAGDPVRTAVSAILGVCGYMIAFNVLAAVLARLIARPDIGIAVLCLLDLPSGALALSAAGISRELCLTLLAAMTGFGGLCIVAQTLSACRNTGISTGAFLLLRVASACLCAGLMRLQLGFQPKNPSPFENPLAASGLIACFLSVPILIHWASSSFLNKEKFDKKGRKSAIKHNMLYDNGK